MKRDLDHLMETRRLDAIVASGHIHGNPPLYYLTDGAALTQAHVIKRRGAPAVLIAGAMEREIAAATGMPVILSSRYDYRGLLKQHQGDRLAASVAYLQRMLEDQHITGRVGFYGFRDQGAAYTFLRALDAALPEIEVVGEFGENLLTAARATKSAAEAARIRETGQRTIAVVRETVAFLQSHSVGPDETLRRAAGEVLTVGDVHDHIRRHIALQGLEDPEGFIFATGRDAGIPHSKGTLSLPLRLGESIVFDIYPREAGGGYFFDMTRTFCLGYAPDAVARIYEDTRACQEQLIAALAVGEETRHYQQLACEFYQQRGHPTIADAPQTLEGYVHSLGHGVGLDLHEEPFFGDTPSNTARLRPGHIFTVEPGLYYPEQGMGCRLEDVLYLDADGVVHNFTTYPRELVIPMD
ncbi:MAG: aminopeptidase P family protein [Chloroflexi bacterium]|nr:MAG: aminopeptidase P family protein [Chloroflexota bacterium]